MKYVLGLSFAALLGGCAIAPAGNADAERGYNHDNGNYLHRDYNDGYYQKFSYRDERGNQAKLAGATLVDEMAQLGTAPKKCSDQAPCVASTLS